VTYSISNQARRLQELVRLADASNDASRLPDVLEKDKYRKKMIENIDKILNSDRCSLAHVKRVDQEIENTVGTIFQEIVAETGTITTNEFEFAAEDCLKSKKQPRKRMPFDL
jgi:hypothetical protein